MATIRVAVIYYSSTGTNHMLAQTAAQAAEQTGAEARLRRVKELAPDEAIDSRPEWRAHLYATAQIPEASLDDLDWADVCIFSMPTRYGNLPAQMKQYIDSTGGLWAQGKLANKVVTAMTSAMNTHGGQETTLQAFYTSMAHWGAIIVPPGYTDQAIFAAGGNPYGTSVSATDGSVPEEQLTAVRHQVRRAVEIGGWIKAGREAAATPSGNGVRAG